MQPEQPKKFSFLDQFKILKTLGSGYHAQVKLGQDQHGNLYAIKRYKKETANLNTLLHELSIMKVLKQQNLVHLVDVRPDATYKKKDETNYKCFAIILEYVGGGELFDLVAETGKFSEKVTRTYFCQMMQGLHYMHSKKYAHRDIKPQNILIGKDYVLKLADFGFSCMLAGKDGSGVLHSKLGTQGYMAPQVPTKNYNGVKVDIFACGVILFVMYTGHPPFQKANKNDAYYKLLKQKRYDIFWKAHSRGKPINYFKDDFKNLFQQMVAFDSNQRPDTLQISKHPWVTKQICTYSEIKAEFEVRIKKLHQILEQKRLQQQAQKLNHIKSVNNLNNMDDRGENFDFQQCSFKNFYLAEQHKARKLHRLQLVNSDDFTIDQEATYAISLLLYFTKNKKVFIDDENQGQKDDSLVLNAVKIHQNEDGFTIKYEKKYEVQQEHYTECMQLNVQFGHSHNNKLSVLLTHISGNRLYFKKVAKQIKNIYSFCIL